MFPSSPPCHRSPCLSARHTSLAPGSYIAVQVARARQVCRATQRRGCCACARMWVCVCVYRDVSSKRPGNAGDGVTMVLWCFLSNWVKCHRRFTRRLVSTFPDASVLPLNPFIATIWFAIIRLVVYDLGGLTINIFTASHHVCTRLRGTAGTH